MWSNCDRCAVIVVLVDSSWRTGCVPLMFSDVLLLNGKWTERVLPVAEGLLQQQRAHTCTAICFITHKSIQSSAAATLRLNSIWQWIKDFVCFQQPVGTSDVYLDYEKRIISVCGRLIYNGVNHTHTHTQKLDSACACQFLLDKRLEGSTNWVIAPVINGSTKKA